MNTRLLRCIAAVVTLCAALFGSARANAQVFVTVDPSQNWLGFMNVFTLGNAYEFGFVDAPAALQANFTTNQLILQPNTNVWETNDTAWVQGDGKTPNDIMDANMYVQNDTLTNVTLIFSGTCVSNTLTAAPEPLTGISYTSVAFIKILDGSFNTIASVTTNLVTGQTFSISLNTAGATHVQYGFETMGPDANPATYTALGNVVIAAAAPYKTLTVDPTQSWIGFMNVFALPVNGGGFVFNSSWGTSALQAVFSGTNFLTLIPDTNVWETNDTFWVQADGKTPNEIMDASMYVQNDQLINTNLVFIGTCLSNNLTTQPEPLTGVTYTSRAFIKTFDGSFNALNTTFSPGLTAGQAFAITLGTVGATHVQYGFETIGPDANPATVASLGTVVLAAQSPPVGPVIPTNNAPTPGRPQSSVLSMYNSSGVYTNHPVERWLASWSGSAESSYTIPATGRVVLKYTGMQFAGVEFYNNDPTLGAGGDNVGGPTNFSINATAYNMFHVDVWTPNANQFGIQLVSINPTQAGQANFLPASGVITNNGWISLDIPFSGFTNATPDYSDLQQLLWVDNQGGGGLIGSDFYIDNVYFYSASAVTRPLITATSSAGSINLSFPTQNGSTYTVQYKTNFSDATWQTLTNITGNGSAQAAADAEGQKSRFYRVMVH